MAPIILALCPLFEKYSYGEIPHALALSSAKHKGENLKIEKQKISTIILVETTCNYLAPYFISGTISV